MDFSRVLMRLKATASRMAPMLMVAMFAHGQDLPYVLEISPDVAAVTAGTVPASSQPLVSATVTWLPVTLTVAGTPLMDLGGYRIHFGASPMALASVIDVPDPGASSYVVRNLSPGTLYFAVTAYSSDGLESDLSTIVGALLN